MDRRLVHRSSLTAVIAATVALTSGAFALAAGWQHAGGDAGRSGNQPQASGGAPFSGVWSAPDRNVVTPVVVSNPGAGFQPRVAYGTSDGRIHLRELYSGNRVGEPVDVSISNLPEVFSGFGGTVAPTDSSTADGLGQLFVVHNETDQADPAVTDPLAVPADDIAIAQIDEATGKLIADLPVVGTNGLRISSSPLLTEPDEGGNRQLIFTAVNRADWQEQYANAGAANLATPRIIRVAITGARFAEAKIAYKTPQIVAANFLNPLASPSQVLLADTNAKTPVQSSFAAVGTGNAAANVQFFNTGDLAATAKPTSPKLDRDGTAQDLALAQTVSIPVTGSGKIPGSAGSQALRAPALIVAHHRPRLERTIVSRLVPNTAGTAFVESARSASYPGKVAAQLATSQVGAAPGTSAGRVVLATGKGLIGLKGSDLSEVWRIDGSFTRTAPTLVGPTVLTSRDDGQPIAVEVETGKPLGSGFQPQSEHRGGGAAFGGPATGGGLTVFGTDRGLFAYRNVCGNVWRGTDGDDGFPGTTAGDDAGGGPGNDTVEGGDGDDCLGGNAGDDVLIGNSGRDAIDGGAGGDKLFGNDGADQIIGATGNDDVHGDDGDDEVTGGDGNDLLRGGNGADRLEGGDDDDTINGNGDEDRIDGGDGDDSVKGFIGNDTIFGGAGNDNVDGGPGNDVLDGGAGADSVRGDAGNDRIEAVDGRKDVIRCGLGDDSATVDPVDTVRDCEKVLVKRQPAAKKKKKAKAKKKKAKRKRKTPAKARPGAGR